MKTLTRNQNTHSMTSKEGGKNMAILSLVRKGLIVPALVALVAAVTLVASPSAAVASHGCQTITPGQVTYGAVWTNDPACFMLTGTIDGGRVVVETQRWGPNNEFVLRDTVLSVYKLSGDPDASGGIQFTRIAHNDDINWPANPYSRVDFTSDGGTYVVIVEGYGGAQGYFKLVSSQTLTVAPDQCETVFGC